MWAERCPDVLGGVAGAVLAFLTLHHHTGEPWALARAVAGGRRLLADRVATPGGGAAWPSEDRRLLAGFGHGAAGIAYALSRLFIAAGDRAYLDAAAAAYRYERSVFSADHGNWPVLTRGNSGGPQIMTAWCHGAAGIGLGRTLARDVLSDEEISAEIERAVTATAQVKLGRSDHLCCGNLGRAEILFTIGQELQRVECLTAGVEISRGVIERALGRGHFAQPSSPFEYCVFDPGFFRGLAGIGYQMLRFLAPARLPSVLGFAADLPAPAPERSWRVGDER
jgi:lantibiotic modifying enzyme